MKNILFVLCCLIVIPITVLASNNPEYVSYSDSSFQLSESGIILDFLTDLSDKNANHSHANTISFLNRGPDNLEIQASTDGSIFGPSITVYPQQEVKIVLGGISALKVLNTLTPGSWQCFASSKYFADIDLRGGVVNTITSVNDFPLTAFGDMRVAEITPILQQSFEYTVNNSEINTNTYSSGGTVFQLNGTAYVQATGSGATAMLQSKHRAKYTTGLGGLLRNTSIFTQGVSGTTQIIGIFDTFSSGTSRFQNGLGMEMAGTSVAVLRCQNGTDYPIYQEDWDDPLNGTGISGVSIDFTKLSPYQIQFQYLGGGNMFFNIEHPDTGKFFRFHQIKYSNLYTSPSTYNPNYYFSMLVISTSGQTVSLGTASYAYFTEGKTEHYELQQPQFSSGATKLAVTTETPIFTIRNKTTYSGKPNFVSVLLEHLQASAESTAAATVSFKVVKNATLGGSPAWSDVHTNNSVVEYDTSATSATGGITLPVFKTAGTVSSLSEPITDLSILLEPGDTITVSASASKSSSIETNLLWKELF